MKPFKSNDGQILTGNISYSPLEVIDYFSEFVLGENLNTLVFNLSSPEIAEQITSFKEENGELLFKVRGKYEMFVIIKKTIEL